MNAVDRERGPDHALMRVTPSPTNVGVGGPLSVIPSAILMHGGVKGDGGAVAVAVQWKESSVGCAHPCSQSAASSCLDTLARSRCVLGILVVVVVPCVVWLKSMHIYA